jgi:hypothetical protein
MASGRLPVSRKRNRGRVATKGNRFYNIDDVRATPAIRLIGNACLSFLNKFSSGYWNIFDPTNGFTAIHANGLKRIFYNYFLRDFSIASLELVFGLISLLFGVIFGSAQWIIHVRQNTFASAGTLMSAVLPILAGLQLLISFINYDVMSVPSSPIHRLIFSLKAPNKSSQAEPTLNE